MYPVVAPIPLPVMYGVDNILLILVLLVVGPPQSNSNVPYTLPAIKEFPNAHGSNKLTTFPEYKVGNIVHVVNDSIVPHLLSIDLRNVASDTVNRKRAYKNPNAGKDGVANAVVDDTNAIRIGNGGV